MEPVNGVAERVFVQFHDAPDLYSLDATSGRLTRDVAHADVPELGNEAFEHSYGGRIGGAYVYFYQCEFTTSDQGALVLLDENADGAFDDWRALRDVQAWEAFVEEAPLDETFFY